MTTFLCRRYQIQTIFRSIIYSRPKLQSLEKIRRTPIEKLTSTEENREAKRKDDVLTIVDVKAHRRDSELF